MKFNKILLSLMITLIMMLSLVSAENVTDIDFSVGDINYDQRISDLNFMDRLKYELKDIFSLSVVGGAVCSTYPDLSSTFTRITTGTYCYVNFDHIGVMVQIFEGSTFLGEKEALQGSGACWTLTAGKTYTSDIYFCDETSSRTCTETDTGKDYYNKGTLTFTLEGYTPENWVDYCSDSTHLNERYCDDEDSARTIIVNCNCLNGACSSSDDDEGDVVNPELPEPIPNPIKFYTANTDKLVYKEGEIIYINGYTNYLDHDVTNAVIETSLKHGDYVIDIKPLSIIAVGEVDTGVCGDDITSGVMFNAQKGQSVQFQLKLTAKGIGEYSIRLISAEGCLEGVSDSYTLPSFKIIENDGIIDNITTTIYKCNNGLDDDKDGFIDFPKDVGCSSLTDNDESNSVIQTNEHPTDEGNSTSTTTNILPKLSFKDKYFDYTNKPEMAYSVTGILLLILFMFIYMLYLSLGGKK